MKIFKSLLSGIIIFSILTKGLVYAVDFGVRAQTFKVEEEPFIQMLKKRLDKIDITEEQNKIQAKAKERIENPTPVIGISPATNDRVFYFDPTYTLDKDAVLPCGKILHKAGTRVNPLEHMDLNRRLFFIDGREDVQVIWLKEQLSSSATKQENEDVVEDRVILVAGSVFKLQEILGTAHADKVYFDQAGELTNKFGIRASPAVVEQENLTIKIKEIDLINKEYE